MTGNKTICFHGNKCIHLHNRKPYCKKLKMEVDYTFEVLPVNYANIEIKSSEKQNFENKLEKLSIADYGMYRIRDLNSDNEKTYFQIEFPIWEKKNIVIQNLKDFKSIFEKSGINVVLKYGNPHLKSKGVYHDDNYSYSNMDKEIIEKNKWAKDLFK